MNIYRKQEDKEDRIKVFTKETFGMIFIVFAALALICLATRDLIFSVPGQYVNAFLLGVFGYTAFVLDVLLLVLGVLMVLDKKFSGITAVKTLTVLFFVLTVILIHCIMTRQYFVDGEDNAVSYGTYLAACYQQGSDGVVSSTPGGLFFGLICYAVMALFQPIGAYIIIPLLMALCAFFVIARLVKNNRKNSDANKIKSAKVETVGEREYPVDGVNFDNEDNGGMFLLDDTFMLKNKKQARREKSDVFKINYPNQADKTGGLTVGEQETRKPVSYSDDMATKLSYITTPGPVIIPRHEEKKKVEENKGVNISSPIMPSEKKSTDGLPPRYEHNEDKGFNNDTLQSRAKAFEDRYANLEEPAETEQTKPLEQRPVEKQSEKIQETNVPPFNAGRQERGRIFDRLKEEDKKEAASASEAPTENRTEFSPRGRDRLKFDLNESNKNGSSSDGAESAAPKAPINRVYNRPPLDLFKVYKSEVNSAKENHEERAQIIESTLAQFGIEAKVQGHVQGPTVTRYEIMMPPGISVKRVPQYADDIAMRLEAETGCRIEAPIPGKNLVGIEVPNKVKSIVGIRDILEDGEFVNAKPDKLMFAIGKDIVGNAICDNLAKGPHYLVAGATGMGKSVCLNAMIVSMISKYSPEDLRLILVDPKQVEFSMYEHLPHLMIDEIVNESQKAIAVLNWAIDEMENRFVTFRETGARDIDEYNETINRKTTPKMCKIVIIVDEVGDLMLYNKKELEAKILKLTQKARAAGIHLVLATQRPSVDVITGVIKTNLPSRIAFRVSNAVDSGTILSEGGAEKLLGNGDMLYKNSVMPKYERYQGAFISNQEVRSVVNYIKENNQAYFDKDILESINNSMKPTAAADDEAEEEMNESEDKLFVEALKFVITTGSASISALQRRFQIGYAKAGGLIDKMDRMKYISPFDGSKARRVLITLEEFEDKYGDI